MVDNNNETRMSNYFVEDGSYLKLKYLKLIHALFIETNPIPVKEAVNQMGFAGGPCRLPLYEMAEGNKAVLVAEMKKQGLL